MNPTPSPTTRRELAAERLSARRRHVRRIRARVAGLSLATFLAASGAVLVQLVTGNDPALAQSAATAKTTTASTQTTPRGSHLREPDHEREDELAPGHTLDRLRQHVTREPSGDPFRRHDERVMSAEAIRRFPCFGGRCAVIVAGTGPAGIAVDAVARAERRMLEWHAQFSRFEPDSELSELNRDPRTTVPVSAVMVRLVRTAVASARMTGGLVDPTLLPELREAGYRRSRGTLGGVGGAASIDLAEALAAAPGRRPATPRSDARWRDIGVDGRARTITRPPGLELDLGGIAKGVFGDILQVALEEHDSFCVNAAGDLRIGGRTTLPRPVRVAPPGGVGAPLHTFHVQRGAVATSGIGRRAWTDPDGCPAHHLLDPGRGRPAFTGLIQVTALAPTGAEAEARAKAALLAGPRAAPAWLPDGGAIVADDGTVTVLDASATLAEERREPVTA